MGLLFPNFYLSTVETKYSGSVSVYMYLSDQVTAGFVQYIEFLNAMYMRNVVSLKD